MLKPLLLPAGRRRLSQPPSGGCVLKHFLILYSVSPNRPAAFRRLGVETRLILYRYISLCPAAFRRLCVETRLTDDAASDKTQPPSGGCVLKLEQRNEFAHYGSPAAFRRLCVETFSRAAAACLLAAQPPSGGCVLKPRFVFKICATCCQPPSGGCVLKRW